MTTAYTFNGADGAELSISGIRRTLVSQAADTLSFSMTRLADEDAEFSVGSTVTVRRVSGATTTVIFVGRVISVVPEASATTERQRVTLAGPWWYLEHCVFEQLWTVWNGSGFVAARKSRVILGQTAAGARQSLGAQIEEAVDWAADRGAPLQLGELDLEAVAPLDEAVDATCAEVIGRMLRWVPDAVTWFDYTTSPPTLHIRRVADLAAVELEVGKDFIQTLEVRPRYDLQVPGVRIRFERTDDVDGAPCLLLAEQTAGNPDAFGALSMTVDLDGGSLVTQKIKTADLAASVANAAWWKAKLPWLAEVNSLVIGGVTGVPEALPRELVEGEIPSWMEANPWNIESQEVEISALVSGTMFSGTQSFDNQKVSVRVLATNARTKKYTNVEAAGETAPAGLAAALYSSIHTLIWEGEVRLLERECMGRPAPGCKLRLTGSVQHAWATLDSAVVRVSEELDEGVTVCEFGPPRYLGGGDWLELLRCNRLRQTARSAVRRTTGAGGGQESGGPGRVDSGSGGLPRFMKFTVGQPGSGSAGVELSPGDGLRLINSSGGVLKLAPLDGTKLGTIGVGNSWHVIQRDADGNLIIGPLRAT